MIEVNIEVQIPDSELAIEVGTSSGPGGQNVNRVQTRVTVGFNVRTSPSLSEAQRERILEALGNRINKDGVLKVRAQQHRSQSMNRAAATERLRDLLAGALEAREPRVRPRVPRAARKKRLEEKRRRSRVKRDRRSGAEPEFEG